MKTFSLLTFTALLAVSCQPRSIDYQASSQVYPCRPAIQPHRACSVVDETYVHKYGFEVNSDEWQNRGEHGQKVTTLNNGITLTESYNFGRLHGESSCTFPYSSDLEKVQTYHEGKLIIDETRYLGNIPKKRMEYLNENQRRVTQWYENGAPHSVEEFINDKLVKGNYTSFSNLPDSQVIEGTGTRTNRDSFGQLTSRDTIEHGDNVERVSYWPNGTPKEMLPYRKGIVHGLRRTFYIGGEPDKVEQWENGVQNGVSIIYQNGEKYAEVPYHNGVKCGIERRFRNGNELFEEINWVDGVEKGPSRTYKPSR